jgi:hypothetical protein
MYGLLGKLLGRSTQSQPVGADDQAMRVTANQTDGLSIGFTTYRPADLTGLHPEWEEIVRNIGDIDTAPVGVPMGPRHFSIHAKPPNWGR